MKVALIHWHVDEAHTRAERLVALGHTTTVFATGSAASPSRVAAEAPDVIVIDLGRLPSHGRMIATLFRQSKKLRSIPLVFVDGTDEKVDAVKKVLPDATYTTWPKMRVALKGARTQRPVAPVVPKGLSYSSTPLVKRLAIKAGARVRLIDAPAGFIDAVGELPEGATFVDRGAADMVLWFVRRAEDLEADIERVVRAASSAPLWIASQKGASRASGGLTQQLVREVGTAMGLVDYKVCSIDTTWSALLFKNYNAA